MTILANMFLGSQAEKMVQFGMPERGIREKAEGKERGTRI